MNKLATYVNECLDLSAGRRAPQQIFCIRVGQNLGSYVASLYLFVKLLYLFNVIGQFFMLNSFIGRGRSLLTCPFPSELTLSRLHTLGTESYDQPVDRGGMGRLSRLSTRLSL